jgi:predicted RNase H-like nuclease (RuvC/YqgF family)
MVCRYAHAFFKGCKVPHINALL